MTWTLSCICLLLAASAFAPRPNPGPGERPNPEFAAALKAIIPLTTGVREDDHPAVASRNGQLWVTWLAYSETEGSTQIFARSLEKGNWTDPVQVSEASGDYHKPAITIDDAGAVWIAGPAQV